MPTAANAAASPAAASILLEFLTERDLCKLTGKSLRSIREWRMRRKGPAWTKVGRSVIYRKSSVERWLSDNEVLPRTSRKVAR